MECLASDVGLHAHPWPHANRQLWPTPRRGSQNLSLAASDALMLPDVTSFNQIPLLWFSAAEHRSQMPGARSQATRNIGLQRVSMSPPVWTVLIRAALKARESGASEIGVDHLRSALRDAAESHASDHHVSESINLFAPAPHWDLPLSEEAKRLIACPGNLDTLSVDRLRSTLLGPRRDQQ